MEDGIGQEVLAFTLEYHVYMDFRLVDLSTLAICSWPEASDSRPVTAPLFCRLRSPLDAAQNV